MAEEEIMIEDDAIALEDGETIEADSSGIIPFIMEKYHRADKYRENDVKTRRKKSMCTIATCVYTDFHHLNNFHHFCYYCFTPSGKPHAFPS